MRRYHLTGQAATALSTSTAKPCDHSMYHNTRLMALRQSLVGWEGTPRQAAKPKNSPLLPDTLRMRKETDHLRRQRQEHSGSVAGQYTTRFHDKMRHGTQNTTVLPSLPGTAAAAARLSTGQNKQLAHKIRAVRAPP